MQRIISLLALSLSSFAALIVSAATIEVPGDHATIQAAIDAAMAGDEINVANGTYAENLVISNRLLILRGTGAGLCVIQGNNLDDAVITIRSPADRTTLITGFTITNGYTRLNRLGGGIDIEEASPTLHALDINGNSSAVLGGGIAVKGIEANPAIINNTIRNNIGSRQLPGEFGGYGGAIFIGDRARGLIAGNQITRNEAWSRAGGIYCGRVSGGGNLIPEGASPKIYHNVISGNTADRNAGILVVGEDSCADIRNNVIANNLASTFGGSGIFLDDNAGGRIINNTVFGNLGSAALTYGIFIDNDPASPVEIRNNIVVSNKHYGIRAPLEAVVEYNLAFGHSFGNVSGQAIATNGLLILDPLFSNAAAEVFTLLAGSPAIDAGDPGFDYRDDDLSFNDMGAFGGPSIPIVIDRDEDGLADTQEVAIGTNPLNPDHDDDGLLDGEEVHRYRTNPLLANTDGDDARATDGVEVQVGTSPTNAASVPVFSADMTLSNLCLRAYDENQIPFFPKTNFAVSVLDPPVCAELRGEGMVFQEELAVAVTNFLPDRNQFYIQGRPRAGQTTDRLVPYVDSDGDGTFDLRIYDPANLDFPSATIQPAINQAILPAVGEYFSKVVVGHEQAGFGFPQFFDIGASGYIRFNGFLPQTVGASLRVATRNVFATNEVFATIDEIYFDAMNTSTARLFALVNSEAFTGALSLDLSPGDRSTMLVDSTWFPRIPLAAETGLGPAFSSLFWKDQRDTPGTATDEAHDSDWLVVGLDTDDNGTLDKLIERRLNNPAGAGQIVLTEFGLDPEEQVVYWALEHRDRNAAHYGAYPDADYETRSSYAIEILSTDVPFSLALQEEHTDSEFNDNIVVSTRLKQALPVTVVKENSYRILYRATAFNPTDTDRDGLTDQLEVIAGTNPNLSDTDNDGLADEWELKYRDPLFEDDGFMDDDQDFMNDFQESYAETDPDDSNSVLRVTSILRMAGDVTKVTWTSQLDRVYQLWNGTNLLNLQPAGNAVTAEVGQIVFMHTNLVDGATFYRVEILPIP